MFQRQITNFAILDGFHVFPCLNQVWKFEGGGVLLSPRICTHSLTPTSRENFRRHYILGFFNDFTLLEQSWGACTPASPHVPPVIWVHCLTNLGRHFGTTGAMPVILYNIHCRERDVRLACNWLKRDGQLTTENEFKMHGCCYYILLIQWGVTLIRIMQQSGWNFMIVHRKTSNEIYFFIAFCLHCQCNSLSFHVGEINKLNIMFIRMFIFRYLSASSWQKYKIRIRWTTELSICIRRLPWERRNYNMWRT